MRAIGHGRRFARATSAAAEGVDGEDQAAIERQAGCWRHRCLEPHSGRDEAVATCIDQLRSTEIGCAATAAAWPKKNGTHLDGNTWWKSLEQPNILNREENRRKDPDSPKFIVHRKGLDASVNRP